MRKVISILVVLCALLAVSCNKEKKPKAKEKIPVPEAVDIGMVITRSDGTKYTLKWASFNLGASNEFEYGNYYAWGETEPKKEYSWANYKYANGDFSKLNKYCATSNNGKQWWDGTDPYPDGEMKLLPTDDVAHVKLGGKWRMPTLEECKALQKLIEDTGNYTSTWELVLDADGNEVSDRNNKAQHGLRLTQKGGNSIFFPAAGYCSKSDVGLQSGYRGFYYTATLDGSYYSYCVPKLLFLKGDDDSGVGNLLNAADRCQGLSVRPVWEE